MALLPPGVNMAFAGGGGGALSGLVTSGGLGPGAVLSGNIASGQVGWPHLASGAVRSGHIGDGAVVSGSIASGQVSSAHFASGTIMPPASGSITSGMIGDAAVLSGSIGSGQIGKEHLASGVIPPLITSGIVASGDIDAGAVLSGNIASGQISSAHFASGTILPPASGSITSGMLGNGSVVSGSIASGSIGPSHLASGAITASGILINASGFHAWLASGDYTAQRAFDTLDEVGVSREPMGFPNVVDSEIFMSGTQFTIQPASGRPSFDVWVRGRKYTFNAPQSYNASGALGEGTNFFYFASGGILRHSASPWALSEVAPVMAVGWNLSSGLADLPFEERHGLTMDWATHSYLHSTVGTRYFTGLTLTGTTVGTGGADADAQVALTDGTVFDEDLRIDITSGLSTSRFSQKIAPIANLPVLFRLGAGGPWRKKTSNNFPVYENAGARISFNLNTAGVWSVPPSTNNANYVATWVFATGNYFEPVVAIMGQREDNTFADALLNNTYGSLAFGNLPFPEAKLLYRLIFQTSTTYGNAPRARLRDIQDLRSVSNLPAGTYVPTDHASLTGLSTYPAHPAAALSTDTLAWSGTLAGVSGTIQAALNRLDQIVIQSGNIASGQIGASHLASGVIPSPYLASGTYSDNAYHAIASVPVADGKVVLIEARVVARRTDLPDRAGYIRQALFYREGGAAVREGPTNTLLTRESSPQYDVTLESLGNNIEVRVRGQTGHTVNWSASCIFEEVV